MELAVADHLNFRSQKCRLLEWTLNDDPGRKGRRDGYTQRVSEKGNHQVQLAIQISFSHVRQGLDDPQSGDRALHLGTRVTCKHPKLGWNL